MARKKVETIIEIIEEIIAPSSLNESEKSKLKSLVKEYGYDSVVGNIPIAQQYLDDHKSEESVHNFIKKLASILYHKSLPLIEQEITHIDNSGKKYVTDWDSQEACVLLQACVKGLKSLRWPEEKIVNDFLKDILSMTRNAMDWLLWSKKIKKLNNKNKKLIKNDSKAIKQSGTILPEGLFVELPHNFGSICKQINASYENNLYDCTAVMMRRLLEVLLVLSFQKADIENEIMASDGKYHVPLDSMITKAVNNSKLALSSNTKNDMKHFKDLGNFSAHKIWYSCTKGDVEPHILKYRAIIEELFYKSGIKK